MEKQPIEINISKLIGKIKVKCYGQKLSKKRVREIQEQVIAAVLEAVVTAHKIIDEGRDSGTGTGASTTHYDIISHPHAGEPG